jgi:hypothetical protein
VIVRCAAGEPALVVLHSPARHHAAPMRRVYIVSIAAGVILFLIVSGLLARVWSAESAERSAIAELLRDEARGDVGAAVQRINGCAADASCAARIAAEVAALKHRGSVSVLQLLPSTGFALGGTLGTARVAWNVGGSLPIIQCVRVQRTGNVLSGLHVRLLAVTPKLGASDATCPARI